MAIRTRPATVAAVFVLLVLIGAYQLPMSLLAAVGALAMETVPAVAPYAQAPTWAVLTSAAIGFVYGTASIALAVVVHRNGRGARTAVTAVHALYAVGILALLLTPVSGVPEVVAAAFAVTVAVMANTASARKDLSGAPLPGHAHPQVG